MRRCVTKYAVKALPDLFEVIKQQVQLRYEFSKGRGQFRVVLFHEGRHHVRDVCLLACEVGDDVRDLPYELRSIQG